MKKLVFVAIAIFLMTGVALAEKPIVQKPLAPYIANGRAAEAEPNDDYTTANPLVVGDDMSAAIDPAGDVDFFAFTATSGMSVHFETMPGDVDDTKMYLYDVDGTTELAYNDDIGYPNYYSEIDFVFPTDGTYFIEVTGYGATTAGTYTLTATEIAPPGPGESCATAVELVDDGITNSVPGAEYWYSFTAPFDGMFIIDTCMEGQAVDTYIKVFDVCEGTMLAYNDDTDCEFYGYASYLEAPMVGGTSYIIMFDDTYTEDPFDFNFYVSDGVVATDATSFDSLKSMYR